MTLALDGSVHGNSSGASSLTVNLTTAAAGDIVCVFIEANGGPVTGVSSPTLGAFNHRATSNPAGTQFPLELWWTYASGALTSEAITASMTTSDFITIDAFGVSSTVGFNHSNPFDSNGSLPAVSASLNADVFVSTTATNSFIIGSYRVDTDPNPSNGSGFTLIHGGDFQVSEYLAASSAQSSLHITYVGTGPGQNGGVGDALIESSGGSFTITAAEGSFTLSGKAVNLLVGHKVTAAEGSFTLSGKAVGLLFGHVVAAAKGQFNLTGENVSFGLGKGFPAGSGSFALSGKAVNLLVGHKVGAAKGAFAFTGEDANLILDAANPLLMAGYGSFTLQGFDASFRLGSIWTPQVPGQAFWTPVTPGLSPWTRQ